MSENGRGAFVVVFACRVVTEAPATPEALEAHLDRVMDELYALGAEDPTLEAALADGNLRFSLVVDAENPIEATNRGSTTLRTAIHAAGGATPDWTKPMKQPWGLIMEGLNVHAGVLSTT